ncbi:hypothetical protein EXIGLDRAFT_724178, partial [Exidia glandulosa HHB12029]
MSYAIMGPRGGQTFMRTYRSARTLGPLLYIDGMSAALTSTGSLDSQDILLYGHVTETRQFDEYTRAARLCEWGKSLGLGVEGFVRQNAGFELLWCDWTKGIELVQNSNVTHWLEDLGEPSGGGWPAPPDAPYPPPEGEPPYDTHDGHASLLAVDLLASRSPNSSITVDTTPWNDRGPPDESPYPPGRPGSGFPRRRPPYGGPYYGWNQSPFSAYSSWEWLRSATSVYSGVGEMRVQLAFGSFVTCYGRSGLSLPSLKTSTHRLTNSSLEHSTALQIRNDVADAVAAYSAGELTGIDWRAVTDQIVNHYGRRLPELHALLLNGTDAAPKQTKYLLASLLIPTYVPSQNKTENVDLCTRTFTHGMDHLVAHAPRERKILAAIGTVQREICETLLSLRADIFSPTIRRHGEHAQQVMNLMVRLDWHLWTRCDDECGWGQVCYIPIWPVM